MTKRRANCLLLLAALLWGVTNVSQKTVLDHIGPFTATGLRFLVASLVVLPFIWRDLKRSGNLRRGVLLQYLEVSLLFTFAVTLLQFAYRSSSVTNASFLVNTTTVMTPLAAWWLLRERMLPAMWMSIAAALSGAFLMSGCAVKPFSHGDFLCLASAGCYSLWFVRLGALVTRIGHSGSVVFVQFLTAGLITIGLGLGAEVTSTDAMSAAFGDILAIGVFGAALPYGLQAVAQQYVNASTAAVLTSAESVFGALSAAILLGEKFSGWTALGAVLVMVAIIAVPHAQNAPQTVEPAA